jgi:enoyl-CoA hydratase
MRDNTVLAERRETGVWVLTLNDPDRRNAIGPEMHDRLIARIDEVEEDPAARALVVRGAGSAFCAGADLPAVFGNPDRPVDEIRMGLQDYYECFLRLRDVPFATIAAVHGPAVGAGLNLALCCDIRLAGPKARFGATFSSIGLHPGGGCSYFLVQAMGAQRALRVLLQGSVLEAEAAVANRLADELVADPAAAAIELAERIALLPAELARDIKQAVRFAATEGFAATLQFEAWAQASSATKPEIQKTVERFRSAASREG